LPNLAFGCFDCRPSIASSVEPTFFGFRASTQPTKKWLVYSDIFRYFRPKKSSFNLYLDEVIIMSLRRISALTLLMLSLGSTAAFAVPNPQQSLRQYSDEIAQQLGQKPGRGNADRVFEQLGLTDAQKAKIKSIRDQYQPQLTSQRQAFLQAQKELRTLMTSNADQSQILEKHSQVMTIKQKLEDLHFQSMLAMREVLTPQQRTQLEQLMKQRHQNMKNQGPNKNNPK
jgi:periplasmic protein CpxP/Spy